jgi:hypothetical protein
MMPKSVKRLSGDIMLYLSVFRGGFRFQVIRPEIIRLCRQRAGLFWVKTIGRHG